MKRIIGLLLLICCTLTSWAQCPIENKTVSAGEELQYDLYFNWKFIWIKCGTAAMKTISTTYMGQPALRTYLQTKGSKQADRFFVMRDTLMSYMTPQLEPLYYRKGALEGKRYNIDEVSFKYNDGQTHVAYNYMNADGTWEKHTKTLTQCAVDMITQLNRARNLSADNIKPGEKINFLLAEGSHIEPKYLVFRKRDVVKANDDQKYKCLVLSFVEVEDGKEKEIITFYVTDDDNHLPVRLDMNLNFGSAKAFLTKATGTKYPITAVVSK